MLNQRIISILLLIPFGALSAYALLQVGYLGLFEYQLLSVAGWQVFADLVVALLLVMLWMYQDAKAKGISPWPWFIVTLALGSFGPLFYLIYTYGRAPISNNSKEKHTFNPA